jgi:hypothetical protein
VDAGGNRAILHIDTGARLVEAAADVVMGSLMMLELSLQMLRLSSDPRPVRRRRVPVPASPTSVRHGILREPDEGLECKMLGVSLKNTHPRFYK